MSAHQLYTISTHYNLKHVSSSILPNYGEDTQIGPMRLHSGAIIALLDPQVVSNLEKDKRVMGIKVEKFNELEAYSPKEDEDEHIYLSLKTSINEVQHRDYIGDTLMDLTISNLFYKDDVEVVIPMDLEHKGFGFIRFSDRVDIRTRTAVCFFLNGYGNIRCSWAKKRASRPDRVTSKGSSIKVPVKDVKVVKKTKGKHYANIPTTEVNAWS